MSETSELQLDEEMRRACGIVGPRAMERVLQMHDRVYTYEECIPHLDKAFKTLQPLMLDDVVRMLDKDGDTKEAMSEYVKWFNVVGITAGVLYIAAKDDK
jgi:hypothetical protein